MIFFFFGPLSSSYLLCNGTGSLKMIPVICLAVFVASVGFASKDQLKQSSEH